MPKKPKKKANPIAKQLRQLGHNVIPDKKYIDKNYKFFGWEDDKYEDKE